jgi:similar to stage IV sporulation protein
MQLKKIHAFLKGYVTLRVKSVFIEKFLNLALNDGIYFFNAKILSEEEIEISVLLSDFWKLKKISQKVNCSIKICKKNGLPFIWHKLKKRKLLITGFIFFIITLYFLSFFVWEIEIKSYENLNHVSKSKIIAAAKQNGLKIGSLKNKIDTHYIEKEIVQDIDMLSWVGIEFKGTKAIVSVVERVIPSKEQLEKGPQHIVAAKDGIINEYLVMVGEPKVKIGDTVHKGQILISGLVYPEISEEEKNTNMIPKKVKARGIIRANVWYQYEYNINLKSTIKKETDNFIEKIYLKIADYKLLIKGPKKIPFDNYEKKVMSNNLENMMLHLKLNIIKEIYYEIKKEEKTINAEEAVDIALKRTLLLIKNKANKDYKVVDKQVNIVSRSKDMIRVKVMIKTYEDISKAFSF